MSDVGGISADLELAAAIDAGWDFDDPVASEALFRGLKVPGIEPDDPELLGQSLTQIARALSLQRRFDEAHATLDSITTGDSDTPTLLLTRIALERGRTHNSAGERDQARVCFDRALEFATRIGASFYAVDALHMLAITTEGDEGATLNRRAIDLARSSTDERARGWAGSLLNNLGWAYFEREIRDEALEAFEQALTERRSNGTPGEVRVARWCVARCQRSMGACEAALATQRELLEELTAGGEVDGFVHEELAECLHALGRLAEARPHFALAHQSLADDDSLHPDRLARLAARAAGSE